MIWLQEHLFSLVNGESEKGVRKLPSSLANYGGNVIVVANKLPIINPKLMLTAFNEGTGVMLLYPCDTILMDGECMTEYFQESIDIAWRKGIANSQFAYVINAEDRKRRIILARQLVPLFSDTLCLTIKDNTQLLPLCREIEYMFSQGLSMKTNAETVAKIINYAKIVNDKKLLGFIKGKINNND